jgi:hypothetical protein
VNSDFEVLGNTAKHAPDHLPGVAGEIRAAMRQAQRLEQVMLALRTGQVSIMREGEVTTLEFSAVMDSADADDLLVTLLGLEDAVALVQGG